MAVLDFETSRPAGPRWKLRRSQHARSSRRPPLWYVTTPPAEAGGVVTRCVTNQILERADGQFDIEVTGATGSTVKRAGLASITEADAASRDLRAILLAFHRHLVPVGGPAIV